MTAFESPWHNLVPYDRPPNASGPQTQARVQRTQSGTLTFYYALRAEMLHVRLPAARSPGPADGLWNHTCFEAFIAAPGIGGYYELNFSPAGQWAVYRFDSYRKGMSRLAVTAPPELVVRSGEEGLELDATISLHELSALQGSRTLKLALTAVIEDDSGTLSYWALKHAPDKPDFHHSDGFVLELPL